MLFRSDYIWVDPKNRTNRLIVSRSGQVTYEYNGEINKKPGAYDPGAVLRAAKAWKTFYKKNQKRTFWCLPARKELGIFYKKCFKEVSLQIPDQEEKVISLELGMSICCFVLAGLFTIGGVMYINSIRNSNSIHHIN